MIPRRVLLVEDDADQRLAVRRVIQTVFPGAEVLEFATGFSVLAAIRDRSLPRAELAVVDRLLTWQSVDEIVSSGPDDSAPPSTRLRGRYVANSLAKSDVPPKMIVMLTILADDHAEPIPGVRYVHVRKDSSLSEFFSILHEVRSGRYDSTS